MYTCALFILFFIIPLSGTFFQSWWFFGCSKTSCFSENYMLITVSQKPVLCLICGQFFSVHTLNRISLILKYMLTSPFHLPVYLTRGFPHAILYTQLCIHFSSPPCVQRVPPILLYLISLIIFSEQYNSWSSYSRKFSPLLILKSPKEKKSKAVPLHAMVAPTHSWPQGVSGQCHAPAALCPGERTPGTHCTGGWVGLRAGLDTDVREKSFAPAGDRTPIVQSVVRHYTDWATPAPDLQSSCSNNER
jgi:hypothetical protein